MPAAGKLAAVAIVAFALVSGHGAGSADQDRTISLDIIAQPIVFDPAEPDHKRVSSLVFRGGLEVSSPHKYFGGYSGLVVSPDGSEMIAISDRGTWLKADLGYQNGNLTNVANGRAAPILGTDGNKVGTGHRDAEGLTRAPQGGYVISFEGRHRLNHYPAAPLPTGHAPEPLAIPKGLTKAPMNKGLEAVVPLSDKQYLLLTEDHRNDDLDTVGWILTNPHVPENSTAAEVSFAVSGLYHPTDAALLPNGDVLVLERRYVAVKGGSMRLRLIAREAIIPGARLVGTILGTIEPPLTVDNMEGLAVRIGPAGETLVYVMSDDNFRTGLGSLFLPSQRTLLMMFELDIPNLVGR